MSEPWQSRYRRLSTSSLDDAFFHYEPGSICWLKAKDDLADDVEGTAELPDGCYNHPAVLLWTEGSGAKAIIFIITSFGGVPLHIRHTNNYAVRRQHLPISPSPPHPDSGLLLEIDGDPLKSNSYIKIEQAQVCTLRALRPHGARKLTTLSYDRLMRFAPVKPLSADNTVQRQRRLRSRYSEALRPASISNARLPVQTYSSFHPYDHATNTSLQHTQFSSQYLMPTEPEGSLRQSLLHPYRTFTGPQRIDARYGTFTAQERISRVPIQPSQHLESSKGKVSYFKICAAVVFVGLVGGSLYGIFVLVRALLSTISQWIEKLLSGVFRG